MPDAISTVAMDDNASHANYNSIDDDDVKLAVDSGSTHSHDSFRNESSPSPPMKVWLKVLDIVTQMFMCGNRNDKESVEVEEVEMLPSDRKESREMLKAVCLLAVAGVAIGVALIWLSFLLIPLILARFFVYLFQPLINFMVGKKPIFHDRIRCRVPRNVAVFLCIVLVVLILWTLAVIIYFSVAEIIQDSDQYIDQFNKIFDNIVEWAEEQGFDREQVLALIPDLTVGEVAVVVVGYLVELVPQAFLCVLFTIYMLLGYDETREKSQIQRSVDQGVRKYIVIKVLVSFITGVLVTIILLSFNVDMALLFGLLTFLLNFIPNVGSMLAVLLPMPVVILDPTQTWWSILCVFFLPCLVQLFMGNVVDPQLTGKGMDISPVAVLACLTFWSAVWGIVGAFISVPLTVSLRLYLLSAEHPMPRFVGKLIGGDFTFFEYEGSYIQRRLVDNKTQ